MSKSQPWLDIFPLKDWDEYIVQFKHGDRKFALNSPEGLKGLLNAFKLGKRTGHNDILKALRDLVANYHNVRKDSVNTLTLRAALLEQIAQKAEKHLRESGMDPEKNRDAWRQEKAKGAFTKETVTKYYNKALQGYTENREYQDVTPVSYLLAKLVRRARRKAEYIKNLKLHCDQKGKGFNTPVELIEYIFRNRQRQDDLVALTPGVLLERMDPWHRAFELDIEKDTLGNLTVGGNSVHSALGLAFYEWYTGGGKNAEIITKNAKEGGELTPFFVWLEGYFVCTGVHTARTKSKDFDAKKVTSVSFRGDNPVVGIIYIGIGGIAYSSADSFELPLDSTCIGESKVPGCLAYVWTKCEELFCAPHMPGSFHHSSFTCGSKVKCAGMIGFQNGKVRYVDNNSGHYKPGTRYLKNFVRFLNERHLFLDAASVRDEVTHASSTVGQFLA